MSPKSKDAVKLAILVLIEDVYSNSMDMFDLAKEIEHMALELFDKEMQELSMTKS
jgi:hypothetical protein